MARRHKNASNWPDARFIPRPQGHESHPRASAANGNGPKGGIWPFVVDAEEAQIEEIPAEGQPTAADLDLLEYQDLEQDEHPTGSTALSSAPPVSGDRAQQALPPAGKGGWPAGRGQGGEVSELERDAGVATGPAPAENSRNLRSGESEDEDGPQPSKPTLRVKALTAQPTHPCAPLFPPSERKLDRTSESLSALAQGQAEEQTLALRVDFAPYTNFASEAHGWMEAIRGGENPENQTRHAAKSGGGVIVGVVRLAWFLSKLAIWVVAALVAVIHPRIPVPSLPSFPGRRREPAPVVKAQLPQIDGQTREMLDQIADKAKDGPHIAVDLCLIATGHAEPGQEKIVDAQLLALCQAAASTFSPPPTEFQQLQWVEAANELETLRLLKGLKPRKGHRLDRGALVLGRKEAARLLHPADESTYVHGLRLRRAPRTFPPDRVPPSVRDPLNPPAGLIPFGVLNAGTDEQQIIAIDNAHLDRHALICGTVGSGKSVCASHLAIGVANANYPMIVVDPHGALCDDILNSIVLHAPDRLDDVILLDVGDEEFPPALNPLDIDSHGSLHEQVESATAQLLEMFKPLNFDESTAPAAVPLTRLAIKAMCHANLALSDGNKLTPLHLSFFFSDAELRRLIVEHCDDLQVQARFDYDTGTYESLAESKKLEAMRAIERVSNSLAKSKRFERMFATTNRLDFPQLIGQKKIVLFKMARFGGGRELGEAVARTVIPALTETMEQWGRTRDPMTGALRGSGCRVIIDEAPKIINGNNDFSSALAETRKYDLGFVTIAQMPNQLDAERRDALFGLTNTVFGFKLDANSVGGLALKISGSSKQQITDSDLTGLPDYHGFANVLVEDEEEKGASGPFFFRGLPPHEIGDNLDLIRERRSYVIERSRREIAVPRHVADERLQTRLIEGVKEELIAALKDRFGPEAAPPPMFSNEPDSAVGADDVTAEFGWDPQ